MTTQTPTLTGTPPRGRAAQVGRSITSSNWARELALLPVIALAMIVGALMSPQFLTANNILNNILVTSAVLGIVVVAESIILISGYFDLSLESVVGLAPMLAVWLVLPAAAGGSGWGFSAWAAFAVMFVLAIVVGLLNGTLVARLRLNAFIVTLAMLILLRGLTMGLSGGQTLSGLPPEFLALGSTRWFGISIQIWLFALILAAATVFMRSHPVGRKLYAMGGNNAAAAAAGIKTTRLTIGVFVAGSIIAAFAGLMLTGRIASVTASQGEGMIFTVFAAAVIGGISLNGGKGSMIGALCGVLLLGIIQNILVLSQVPSFWIEAIYGLIILGALVFNYLAGSKRSRRVV
ncbi:ABC transporter permease [uncultured Kocuria sp.]|uniref:ABC transporter permease n=1 Tax=uncultured Kocuria sp. TaxID=259305 RepID=UPI002615DE2C|nr:ABC transporter permease [uncultured Kocuria sp.]